jgi:MYXO-CTERM domain-containing protein
VRRGVDAFVIAVSVVVAALSATRPARANGAFPDSESILTPADRPQDILLVTNFGLVTSADGGATWLWSCEQDANQLGSLYQLTPAPRNRLLALANQGLVYSDDRSCGWQTGGGAIAGQSITDAFLDPVSGTRVLAIGVASQVFSLFPSTDVGTTFGPAIYQAAAGQNMTGVEIARSDANIVYIALRSSEGAPLLGRSTDGGAHFALEDLSADLGTGLLRIIAIDPQDPNRVLLRFLGANDESIALTVDGGMTARKPVTVNGYLNSYVRLSNGTILVSGLVNFSTTPGLFRSRDQGNTFEQVPGPPAIRALSQRNGLVYAAADNFGDGYAIGTSSDEGTTWTALMTYAEVKAISACLKASCQMTCAAEVGLSLWTADVCAADPPATGTGGVGGSSGLAGQGGGGGSGGTTGRGGAGAQPPPKHGGCAVGGATDAAPAVLPLVLLLLALAVGARRRRRSL